MNTLADCNATDFIQNRKLILNKMLVILLLKHVQIAVTIHLQQQTVSCLCPLEQTLFHLSTNSASLGIRAGFHQIVIVVQHQDSHDGTGCKMTFPQQVALRGIHPVSGCNQILVAATATGTD